MVKKRYWILGASAVVLLVAGVIVYNKVKISEDEYKSITMDEVKEIFAEAGDYIILDVRRADEYAEGHIPGAVNLANEAIGATQPAELPEKDRVIYVYCRSGRRSKEAAAKLAALGYTNIIECGGILDWTGAVEK